MNKTQVAAQSHNKQHLALIILATGLFILFFDAGAIAVAMPSLMQHFDMSLADSQHSMAAMYTVLASCVLAAKTFCRRYTPQPILCLGLGLLFCGAMAASLANSTALFIGARVVQGVGGACVAAASFSLLEFGVPPGSLHAVQRSWRTATTSAAIAGPLVGAIATQWMSWPWIWWSLAVMSISMLAMVWSRMPAVQTTHPASLDWIGLILSASGIIGVVHGVIARSMTATLVSCIALLAFIVWERLRVQNQQSALFNATKIRLSTFTSGNISALCVSIAGHGLLMTLPIVLVSVFHLQPIEVAGVFVAAVMLAFFIERTLRHYSPWLSAVASVVLTLGCVLMFCLHYAGLDFGLHAAGLGVFACVLVVMGLRLAHARFTQHVAVAFGTHIIGIALGTALIGGLFVLELKVRGAFLHGSGGFEPGRLEYSSELGVEVLCALMMGAVLCVVLGYFIAGLAHRYSKTHAYME